MDNGIRGSILKDLIPRSNQFRTAYYYKGFNNDQKINIVIQTSSDMAVSLPSQQFQ